MQRKRTPPLPPRMTPAMSVTEFGFDEQLFEQLAPWILTLPFRHYWRVEPIGLENVPASGGALMVANHSGVVPIDAAMIKASCWFQDEARRRNTRILVEKLVIDLPYLNVLFNRTGQVLACPENTLELLRADELVLVFPEGVRGISQPYSNRYRLQRFGRGGFVRMAILSGKPIIPVAVVGAEECFRVLFNFKFLVSSLGVPYIPVTSTFPWLGPLGLVPKPTKWYIVFGKPLPMDEYRPEDANDDALVQKLADRVREIVQHMLHAVLQRRQSVMLGS